MRIAQISTCWAPTPPRHYGGTELVVSSLTEELVRRGHDVTLFAPGDSCTTARLESYYETSLGTARIVSEPYAGLPHVLHAYDSARTSGFDVVHDHTYPMGPALGSLLPCDNVVHTLHVPFDSDVRALYQLISDRLHFVAISEYQRQTMPELRYAATIHHGIDVTSYPYRSDKEGYLLFFARMSPDKGPDRAVEIARRLGRRLVMVSKMAEPAEQHYFETQVKPLLTPDVDVELVREVSVSDKAAIFGAATCTLMPIRWHEPFGLVMIESLACGTPVAGFRRGSVPEIVDDGLTGFVRDDLDGLVAALADVDAIEPAACRAAAEARFTIATMVERYEAVYSAVASRADSAPEAARTTRSRDPQQQGKL
ncbi:MAG: glycosyltransferase family 4 protein [Actinomycetota bacterium]|nr:glycosyltransferase family 4 protein [Actinomycetota bacterium]